MEELQRVANGGVPNQKIPHGYRPAHDVYHRFQRSVNRWCDLDKLEGAINWHYQPSYFVDDKFFSKTSPSDRRKNSDRLKRDIPCIQRYVHAEDGKALAGLSVFLFRRFIHEHLQHIKFFSYQPHGSLRELPQLLKEQILVDYDQVRDLIAAGPATLTQYYARQILLEMTYNNSPLFECNEGLLVVSTGKIPDDYALHSELNDMAGLVVRADEARINRLADECIRFSKLYPEMIVKKEFLANHLGIKANTTAFGRVWQVFKEMISPADGIRLQGTGRPAKNRSGQIYSKNKIG